MVVLVGIGAGEIALPSSVIQNRELRMIGAFRCTDTWQTTAGLVASGQVNLDGLITPRFGLDELDQALDADENPGSLNAMVVPA